MKNFLLLGIFFAFPTLLFSQGMSAAITSQNQATRVYAEATVPENDIAIVKPLINTNAPDGGYYSEYYGSAFHFMICGAVVSNYGASVATHVHLEFSIRDYNQAILETYYSDSILTLNPGEVDTIYIPGELTFENWLPGITDMVFVVTSDLIDENPLNNERIVPFTMFSDWMWTFVSRSINPTNSFNINQSSNFFPGDFLGFRLSIPNGYHFSGYVNVYLPEIWPDSVTLTAKIYRNQVLMDSAAFLLPNPPQPGWVSSGFLYDSFIEPDSLYYIGIEINYTPGTSFSIGVDTSSYHNFPAEAIAKLHNTWTSPYFVPVIQLISDPEGIGKTDGSGQIRVYPNPASGVISIDHAGGSTVELYNLTGELIFTDNTISTTRTIDISFLPAGVYILRLLNKEASVSRKITVVK